MNDVFDDIKFPKLPQVDKIICLMMMQDRLLSMPGATICVYLQSSEKEIISSIYFNAEAYYLFYVLTLFLQKIDQCKILISSITTGIIFYIKSA